MYYIFIASILRTMFYTILLCINPVSVLRYRVLSYHFYHEMLKLPEVRALASAASKAGDSLRGIGGV